MNKWIAFFISLVASFIMAAATHAQEEKSPVDSSSPQDLAKKYGITFPIAEFGNCQDYAACHAFCEDPVNDAVCKAYFKVKGAYTEESKDQIISLAKGELGCDSKESCEAFCQSQENQDKCNAFVNKYRDKLGVKGGYVKDPVKLADQAIKLLRCDSAESCLDFCKKEENRQKCDEFKAQVGCRGGIEHKGPGGCNSEETCQAFCSDPNNFAECSKFGPPSDHPDKAGHFKGPGGCDSEQSCQAYCQQNPHECKIVAVGGPGLIDPTKAAEEYKKFCQIKPEKCAGADFNPFSSKLSRTEFERFCEANPERCGGGHEKEFEHARKAEFNKFCQENPQKCQTGLGGYQIPTGFHSGGGFIDPNDWCQKYPDRCSGGKDYNPEAICKQSPNCKWENNSCICGFYDGSPKPYPSYSAYPSGSPYPYPSYSPRPDYTPWPNYTPQPYSSYTPYPRPYATAYPESGSTYTPQPYPSYSPTTSTFTPAPTPAQTSTPTTTTSTPVPEPVQSSTPQPQQSTPAPSPQVQGIFTTPSLIYQLLNFFH